VVSYDWMGGHSQTTRRTSKKRRR